MDRLNGAAEAVGKIREQLWKRPEGSFDAAFSSQQSRPVREGVAELGAVVTLTCPRETF